MNQDKVSKKNSRITEKKNISGKSAVVSPKDYKILYEREVAKNRELYLSLFRKQKSIMLMVDVSTQRIIDANHVALEFYGYPYEALTKMFAGQLSLLPQKKFAKTIRRAFNEDQYVFTGQHRLANNEIRDVEIHSGHIDYENKEVIIATIYDVTERTKAQKELEKSEEKFRKVFKTSPDSVTISRVEDGKYIETNESFTAISGYTQQEAIGKTSFELNIWVDKEDRKQLVEILKEKGLVKNFETRFRKKNGNIFHGLMSANIINISGTPHILSITRNVEEYINTQKALQQSEQRYKTLFDLSPTGILLLDESGTILDANPTYCHNFSYKNAENIKGKKIWDVVYPQDKTREKEVLNDIRNILQNNYHEKEVVNYSKSGLPVYLHLFEARITLENNKPAILSISIDVTREKHIREELARNTERLKEAQEIGKIGNWELNWQTNKLYWSDEMYRLLELNPSQDVDYKLFQKIIHPDDLKAAREILKESVKNGTSFKYIHRFLFKDGKIKWAIERGKSFYDKNGKVIRTHGTVQDITLLKETEDKLKELNESLEKKVLDRTASLGKKQQDLAKLLNDMQIVQRELRNSNHALKNLNHELEAFSYSVSHDLKAPLRAIRGFATIIKEDYFSAFDENGKILINDILAETDSMTEIIDALLQLSRTGRKNLNFVEFDLKPLAQSIFSEQQKEFNLPHARFKVHELPPVFADYTLIKQLMVNLLSNALKYSSHEPQPFVEIGFSKDNEENETIFYVKDNGVGFDEETAEKMFRAFRRLHSKKDFEGTGIGLAIAKRIVLRHRGKIWAKSKKGEGATFFFTLSESNKSI